MYISFVRKNLQNLCCICTNVPCKDNIVTRLNIRVRCHNSVLCFNLTKQIPMRSKLFSVRSIQVFQNFHLFRWGINVMVWSGELCVEICKPEYTLNSFSIDHSRTVWSVNSSSTLFMVPCERYIYIKGK